MNTQQATPILRYSRLHEVEESSESRADSTENEISKLNEAVTWGALIICLAGWAVIGLFLWIPKVVRAVVLFSVALVHSTLAETGADQAGRRLRSAADFYRRGFVGAVESIRQSGSDDDEGAEESDAPPSIESGLILREATWAIVVWYVILWPTGVLEGTPLDLAAVPWSDLWSGWVETVWSIPELFRA